MDNKESNREREEKRRDAMTWKTIVGARPSVPPLHPRHYILAPAPRHPALRLDLYCTTIITET